MNSKRAKHSQYMSRRTDAESRSQKQSAKTVRSPHIDLRVTTQELVAVDRAAAQLGANRSDYVRQLLLAHIAGDGNETNVRRFIAENQDLELRRVVDCAYQALNQCLQAAPRVPQLSESLDVIGEYERARAAWAQCGEMLETAIRLVVPLVSRNGTVSTKDASASLCDMSPRPATETGAP
jgi:hypothetical protein